MIPATAIQQSQRSTINYKIRIRSCTIFIPRRKSVKNLSIYSSHWNKPLLFRKFCIETKILFPLESIAARSLSLSLFNTHSLHKAKSLSKKKRNISKRPKRRSSSDPPPKSNRMKNNRETTTLAVENATKCAKTPKTTTTSRLRSERARSGRVRRRVYRHSRDSLAVRAEEEEEEEVEVEEKQKQKKKKDRGE